MLWPRNRRGFRVQRLAAPFGCDEHYSVDNERYKRQKRRDMRPKTGTPPRGGARRQGSIGFEDWAYKAAFLGAGASERTTRKDAIRCPKKRKFVKNPRYCEIRG